VHDDFTFLCRESVAGFDEIVSLLLSELLTTIEIVFPFVIAVMVLV
jgi:hypothetical protein